MNRLWSSRKGRNSVLNQILGVAVAACAIVYAGRAQAQSIIKQPGNHPAYAVDLEPHLLFNWDDSYYGGGGFGLGLRATIPFLRNGPIPNINNDMGIGFGLDWATHGGGCNHYYGWANNYSYYDCSAYSIYLPIVLQWNFYLTDMITVYGEPGLAIRYAHISYTYNAPPGVVQYSDGYTDPVPVFGGGAKFMFGRTIGLNVRLGYPYFSVGASFLL